MTAEEVYELATGGGARDFARVVALCRGLGPFCLIDGLAVNCYVEPVYTLDADFVVVAESAAERESVLRDGGFVGKQFPHSLNAQAPKNQLRVQFTTDPRYRDFPSRASDRTVLGAATPVASLKDIVQGKLWAYGDAERRLSKRKKDELDLFRIGEAFPEMRAMLPPELRQQLEAEE